MLVIINKIQLLFFFFQAADGIRDYKVTGVQTCALPISCLKYSRGLRHEAHRRGLRAELGERKCDASLGLRLAGGASPEMVGESPAPCRPVAGARRDLHAVEERRTHPRIPIPSEERGLPVGA